MTQLMMIVSFTQSLFGSGARNVHGRASECVRRKRREEEGEVRRWGITAAEHDDRGRAQTRICENNQEERRANKVTVRTDQSIEGNKRPNSTRKLDEGAKERQKEGKKEEMDETENNRSQSKDVTRSDAPRPACGFFLPLHFWGCLWKLLRKSGAEGHLKLFPAVCNHQSCLTAESGDGQR